MAGQTEVRESHEQFSAGWALDARAGGVGEVVDMVAEALATASCGRAGTLSTAS
jgi:hypothetical protein